MPNREEVAKAGVVDFLPKLPLTPTLSPGSTGERGAHHLQNVRTSLRSSQLEQGKRNADQTGHHADDPEAHRYLSFGPSHDFEMMV